MTPWIAASIYESFVKVAVKFLLSTPKMLLSKPTPVIHNTYPLLSDSSIRRLETVSQFIAARKIAQRTKIICQAMGSI
jgi:hypothetical protein